MKVLNLFLLSLSLVAASVSQANEQCLAVYRSSQIETSMLRQMQERLINSPNKMPSLLVIDSISQGFKKVEQKYATMIASLTGKLSDANINAKLEVLAELDKSFQKLDKMAESMNKDLSNPKIVKQLDHIGAQFFQMKQQIDLLEPQLRTAIEKSLQIRSQIEILNAELNLLSDELLNVKNNLAQFGWKDESDNTFVRNILDQKLVFLNEMSSSLSAIEKNLKSNIYTGLTQLEVTYEFMRHRLIIHEASGVRITPAGIAGRNVVKLGEVKNRDENRSLLDGLENDKTQVGQSLLSAFEKLPREQALSMYKQALFDRYGYEQLISISELLKLVRLVHPDNVEPTLRVVHSRHKMEPNFFKPVMEKDILSSVADISLRTYDMVYLLRRLVDQKPNRQLVEYIRDLLVNDLEYTITKWEEHKTAVVNWSNTPFYKKSIFAKKPNSFEVFKLSDIDRIISALYIKKTKLENELMSFFDANPDMDFYHFFEVN